MSPATEPARLDAAARRRVIALAVARRPDISAEQLVAVLGRLGHTVALETVRDDLSVFSPPTPAIGGEEEAAPGRAADHPPDPEAEPEAELTSEADTESGAEPVAGPDPASVSDHKTDREVDLDRDADLDLDDDVDRDADPDQDASVDLDDDVDRDDAPLAPAAGRGARLAVRAVLVLAFVAALAAAVLLVTGLDRDPAPAEEASRRVTAVPVDSAPVTREPVAWTEPPGPGQDLAAFGAPVDDFARPGPEVGELPGVGAWEALGGDWAIGNETLALTRAEETGSSLLVVDPGSPDVRFEVTVVEPARTAGVAFRVRDGDDFMIWATAPDYGTVVLIEVVDGEPSILLFIERPLRGRRPVLGVSVAGTAVDLFFDGERAASWEELAPSSGGERVGVGVVQSGGNPLFDDATLLVG